MQLGRQPGAAVFAIHDGAHGPRGNLPFRRGLTLERAVQVARQQAAQGIKQMARCEGCQRIGARLLLALTQGQFKGRSKPFFQRIKQGRIRNIGPCLAFQLTHQAHPRSPLACVVVPGQAFQPLAAHMFAQGYRALVGLGAGQWGVFQHQRVQHPLAACAHKPGLGNRKVVFGVYLRVEKLCHILLCKSRCKSNAPAWGGPVHLCHGQKLLTGKRVIAGKLRRPAAAQQKCCAGGWAIAGGGLLLFILPHGNLLWPG